MRTNFAQIERFRINRGSQLRGNEPRAPKVVPWDKLPPRSGEPLVFTPVKKWVNRGTSSN